MPSCNQLHKTQMHKFFILSILIILVYSSQIKNPVSLAVTIYNNQFAIVKDTRSIQFDKGRSDLFFTDVSSRIQTQTVTFKAVTNPENIQVYQQNYEANLINTQSILKKYIQKNVSLWARLGDRSVRVEGKLLGYDSGYIIQTQYGIEVFKNVEGIQFVSLPSGFFTKPTLNWKVNSKNAITTQCQVAYRTSGFSWKADYTVILNQDQSKADVGGWVTIDNRSGKQYDSAKLKLIAGDVNVVKTQQQIPRPVPMAMMAMSAAPLASAPTFSQKSFSDFHLYTLSQPVTLNDNSQKQVQFIPKVYNIAVRKYNLISISSGNYDQKNLKASNKIEIGNTKANKLGIPLPKGTVRAFKADQADGSLEFIGQDSIDHTPKDQNITLNTGNAFDITADKIAINDRTFVDRGYQADLSLTISNHKDIKAQIVVQLSNYSGDNVQFTWKTQGINIEKASSTLIRIKKIFNANQKFVIEWHQSARY